MPSSDNNRPFADAVLVALATMEQANAGDQASFSALLDTSDTREIAMGLFCIANVLTDMLSAATEADATQVFARLRSTVLDLIDQNRVAPGPASFATPAG